MSRAGTRARVVTSRAGRLVAVGSVLAVLALVGATPLPSASADQVSLQLVSYAEIPPPVPSSWIPLRIDQHGHVLSGSNPPGLLATFSPSDPTARTTTFPPHGTPIVPVFSSVPTPSGLVAGYVNPDTDPGAFVPVVLDLSTGAWTELPHPAPASATVVGSGGLIAGIAVGSDDVVGWSGPSGAMVDSGRTGSPVGVTADGRVLVEVDHPPALSAFFWSPATGTFDDLVLPAPGRPIAVSAQGQILLYDGNSTTVWDTATGRTETISTPSGRPGYLSDSGLALVPGASGWVVVDAVTGAITPVDPYPGDPSVTDVTATAIDDAGHVAGTATLADGSSRLFVWDAVAHTVTLAAVPAGVTASPVLLGAGGVVTGRILQPGTGGERSWVATFRTAPDAPQRLSGASAGASVALSWKPPVVAGDAPISGYVVRRDGQQVAQVGATAQTWSGPPPDASPHSYTVEAVNTYGESPPSNAVSVAAGPVAAGSVVVVPSFTG